MKILYYTFNTIVYLIRKLIDFSVLEYTLLF